MIKRYLSLWFSFAKNSLIRQMEFKANFILDLCVEIAWVGTTIFALEIIFSQTKTIAGWTKGEVLLIYALYKIGSAITAILITKNTFRLPYLVNSGELDHYLTKPVDSHFITLTRFTAVDRISQLLTAAIILGYSFVLRSDHFTLTTMVKIASLVPIIATLRFSIESLVVTPVFWLQNLRNIPELIYALTKPATFPRFAFPAAFRHIFTFLIPMFFIAAIPAEIVLGKSSLWIFLGLLCITATFLILARFLFIYALRHYSSASS